MQAGVRVSQAESCTGSLFTVQHSCARLAKRFLTCFARSLSHLTLDTLQNARLLGETWILNKTLKFDKLEAFGANDFYSNGQIFSQMSHYHRDGKHWLYYGTHLVNFDLTGWVLDNYRVISFTQRLCKTVLNWLEQNAVKLQFWRERNDRERIAPASSG